MALQGFRFCTAKIRNIFSLVHLFGHKDEGGFDENTLESIRSVIESTKNELITADQLLDETLCDKKNHAESASEIVKLKII